MSAFRLVILGASALLAVDSGAEHRAARAAPHLIVFAGAPLTHRVVMTNWEVNLSFMTSLSAATVLASDTAGRQPIDVGMFYGRSVTWTERNADQIPIDQAPMPASYYPARGKRPAFLIPRHSLLTWSGWSGAKTVSAKGLKILESNGVPVHDVARTR
ncbi:MAG: hypothetical protein V4550_16390 [Gemmatimonadota bacterium]